MVKDILEYLPIMEEEKGLPYSVDLYLICGWCDSYKWTRFVPEEVSANKIFA